MPWWIQLATLPHVTDVPTKILAPIIALCCGPLTCVTQGYGPGTGDINGAVTPEGYPATGTSVDEGEAAIPRIDTLLLLRALSDHSLGSRLLAGVLALTTVWDPS
ncbi:hypothetical protein Bbelb_166940 [Branchiostoma belcheri]|nr:hypothetical protein Bbelb_166940 [Branchiostoma belcheri]